MRAKWIVFTLLLIGCAAQIEPTATVQPTETAAPLIAATRMPTDVPSPTATYTPPPTTVPPTNTPIPTNTPMPTTTPMPTNTPEPANFVTLFDFNSEATAGNWFIVNDDVMGGVSQSALTYRDGFLLFAGDISLDNNGGFASIRSQLPTVDLVGTTAVTFRIYGDGQRYRFQLYTSGQRSPYEAFFETADQAWSEVTIPFSDFRPTYFGRFLNGDPIDPAKLVGTGIILQDKQDGKFGIALDWISAY